MCSSDLRLLAEGLDALGAAEGPLTVVEPLVQAQRGRLGEALAALAALVGLLPGVRCSTKVMLCAKALPHS